MRSNDLIASEKIMKGAFIGLDPRGKSSSWSAVKA